MQMEAVRIYQHDLKLFSQAMDSLEALLEYPDAWGSVDSPQAAVDLLESKLRQVLGDLHL